MKLITARIEPHRLDMVRGALVEMGIANLTATEVRGYAGETAHAEISRGSRYEVGFMPMVKIDAVAEDDMVDQAIDVIKKTGMSGRGLNFRIWMTDVQVVETG